MKKPEHIVFNEEDINSLLGRVLNCNLKASDKKIITGIIQIYQVLQWTLQEAKISVQRLRSLFGFKQTEKRCHLDHPGESSEEMKTTEESLEDKDVDSLGCLLSQALESLKKIKFPFNKEKKKGHGRLGHEAYSGAKIVEQAHESLKAGDLCPEECGGRLYALEPKTTVCLTGHALASATKYLLERLRCALCGKVFTAKNPIEMPIQKYDEALKAYLAIAKNYGGMPFYRLQMLQNMVGVPLPHPTQWKLTEALADDIYPKCLPI